MIDFLVFFTVTEEESTPTFARLTVGEISHPLYHGSTLEVTRGDKQVDLIVQSINAERVNGIMKTLIYCVLSEHDENPEAQSFARRFLEADGWEVSTPLRPR